jgi:methionine synthase II (cobalamin-independent)
VSHTPVLLVGSVPLANAEEVLSTAGELIGDHVAALPDGEPADRHQWINFLALRTYYMHPQLDSVQRPATVDGEEQWIPASPGDHWQFRVKPGVTDLRFEDLRYAGAALSSYLTFRELKDSGRIPQHVRFQVCLPFPWSATLMFFMTTPADLEQVVPAYERALIREIRKLTLAIPDDELSIQFDVCMELLDLEGVFPFAPQGNALERFTGWCRRIAAEVPENVRLGYHFCYADLGHRHIKEPEDLTVSVTMANAAVASAGRRVDYVHMAVPRDRHDDAYFQPLAALDAPGTTIYLGLVHFTDGAEGTRRRIRTARAHLPHFGIATECGFGRRPPEQVGELLRLHATLAAEPQ